MHGAVVTGSQRKGEGSAKVNQRGSSWLWAVPDPHSADTQTSSPPLGSSGQGNDGAAQNTSVCPRVLACARLCTGGARVPSPFLHFHRQGWASGRPSPWVLSEATAGAPSWAPAPQPGPTPAVPLTGRLHDLPTAGRGPAGRGPTGPHAPLDTAGAAANTTQEAPTVRKFAFWYRTCIRMERMPVPSGRPSPPASHGPWLQLPASERER